MHAYLLIAALLLPSEAIAEPKYFFCQYAGIDLKSGGQAAMVSNVFMAEDEDTAEDMFQTAADEQHDYYRSSAFCRASPEDSGRLESDRNAQMLRFRELEVLIWDVAVGQPVEPTLSDENRYGEPLYWQCSYYSSTDGNHYFSTVAPIPAQPNKGYMTVNGETLAGFGNFLKQEYGVDIEDGGSCTGAPMREETELVHESGKRGSQEAEHNVVQTDWLPMDVPMSQ